MTYLGENIRKLGFGLMRLPMVDGEVDLQQLMDMVDLFLENGFTYFDTAYGYIGGKSEKAVKAALVDRYPRDRFQLATKLPAWDGAKTAEEAKSMFYTSLERTGAGYFDYYLLHNLGEVRTRFFDEFGIWDFLEEQKKRGLIRHLGFSFHDKADVLEELLMAHPEMEFVQLQINYADWESDAIQSRLCYETARRHNKPVIIMEPVKGGSLANPPRNIREIFEQASKNASPASWAIRYAASLDGLITVLSGMSTLDQMKDNVAVMSPFKPLDESERAVIDRVRDAYSRISGVPCTTCGYCAPGCPMSIRIPQIFTTLNVELVYGEHALAKSKYAFVTRFGALTSECIACGHCEQVCPQHIDIINQLKKAASLFE